MKKKKPSLRPNHDHVAELMERHVRGRDPLCEAWALVAAGVASGDASRCSKRISQAIALGADPGEIAFSIVNTDSRHGALACLDSGIVNPKNLKSSLEGCIPRDRPRSFIALGGSNSTRLSPDNRHRPSGPDMPASYWAVEEGAWRLHSALLGLPATPMERLCSVAGALSWVSDRGRDVGKRLLAAASVFPLMDKHSDPMPECPGLVLVEKGSEPSFPDPADKTVFLSLLRTPAFAIAWKCSAFAKENPVRARRALILALRHADPADPAFLGFSPASALIRHPSVGKGEGRSSGPSGTEILPALRRLPAAMLSGTGPGSCLAAACDAAGEGRTSPFPFLSQALVSKGVRIGKEESLSLISRVLSSPFATGMFTPSRWDSRPRAPIWKDLRENVLIPAGRLAGREGLLAAAGLCDRIEDFLHSNAWAPEPSGWGAFLESVCIDTSSSPASSVRPRRPSV